jgi:WD40 repeat protein
MVEGFVAVEKVHTESSTATTLQYIADKLGVGYDTVRGWRYRKDNTNTKRPKDENLQSFIWLVMSEGHKELEWMLSLLRTTTIVVEDSPSYQWVFLHLKKAKIYDDKAVAEDSEVVMRNPTDDEVNVVMARLFPAGANAKNDDATMLATKNGDVIGESTSSEADSVETTKIPAAKSTPPVVEVEPLGLLHPASVGVSGTTSATNHIPASTRKRNFSSLQLAAISGLGIIILLALAVAVMLGVFGISPFNPSNRAAAPLSTVTSTSSKGLSTIATITAATYSQTILLPTNTSSLPTKPNIGNTLSATANTNSTEVTTTTITAATTSKILTPLIEIDHPQVVLSASFSPDDKLLATAYKQQNVRIFQIDSNGMLDNKVVQDLKTDDISDKGQINAIAFSPDGKWLGAVASYKVNLWMLGANGLATAITPTINLDMTGLAKPGIQALAFDPHGKILAVSNSQTGIILLDLQTRKVIQTLVGHTNTIWDIKFSINGDFLASASSDNTVRLWNTQTGQLLQIINTPGRIVSSIAIRPDGSVLVTGDDKGKIQLWNVENGQELQPRNTHAFEGHTGPITTLTFSQDGKLLFSCSLDHFLKIWDFATGTQVATTEDQVANLNSVAISHNSKFLALSIDGRLDIKSLGALKLFDIEHL